MLTFASESKRRRAARLCRPRSDSLGDEEVRVGAAVDLHSHRRLTVVILCRRVDLELDAVDAVTPASEEAFGCLLDLRGTYSAQRWGRRERLALRVDPQLAVCDFDRVQALLGLVDALDVLVDGAHEAVRHSVQHKRVRALGEADEACQDCRGHIVDCRRRARRLGAEVDHDVEVVRLEHRALELDRFVALVADLDRRDRLAFLRAALGEFLLELADDRFAERIDELLVRRHVVGIDPACLIACALTRQERALRLELAVAPAVRSARAHGARRLLSPLRHLQFLALLALRRGYLVLDLGGGLFDVLDELVAEALQGEHGAVVDWLDVLARSLRNIDALRDEVALLFDLVGHLLEYPAEECVRGLAHTLRRDAQVRLEQRDRELDGVLVHAEFEVLRRLELLQVCLLIARVPCRQQGSEACGDLDARGCRAGYLAFELEQLVLEDLALGLGDLDEREERRCAPHVGRRSVLVVRDDLERSFVVLVRPRELEQGSELRVPPAHEREHLELPVLKRRDVQVRLVHVDLLR